MTIDDPEGSSLVSGPCGDSGLDVSTSGGGRGRQRADGGEVGQSISPDRGERVGGSEFLSRGAWSDGGLVRVADRSLPINLARLVGSRNGPAGGVAIFLE